MKYNLLLILSFSASIILAQNKHDLSFEFNVNKTHYKMESLNQYLGNNYWFSPQYHDTNEVRTIKKGVDLNLGLSYQPFHFLDFGIFANYQASSIRHATKFVYFPGGINPDTTIYEGTNYIEVNALSVGVSTHLYLNKLMHLDQSKSVFLRRLQLSVGLQGGVGFGTFVDRSMLNDSFGDMKRLQHKTRDFQGRAEFGLGYRIGKGFFSDLGFKIGYQFFKMSMPPKDYGGIIIQSEADNSDTIFYLDFSGLYYGVYLKIGK